MTVGSIVDFARVEVRGGDDHAMASVVCLGDASAVAALGHAWSRSNPYGLDLILAETRPGRHDVVAEAVAERLRRPFALLVCNGFPDAAVSLLQRRDLVEPLLRIFVSATNGACVPTPLPPQSVADADLHIIATIRCTEPDVTSSVLSEWRRTYGTNLAVRLISGPEATTGTDGLTPAVADEVVRVVADEMRVGPANTPFIEVTPGDHGGHE